MREGVSWPRHMKVMGFDPKVPTQAELDIMKEKAEALGRVGGRLDESLRRITIIEQRIAMLKGEGKGAREVNALIREFNQVRQKALRYLHYLIIQREAIGFRRHANVTRTYQIPPPKKDFSRKTMYERIIAHKRCDRIVCVGIRSYRFRIDDVRRTGYNTMKSFVANETAGATGRTIDGR